MTDELRHIILKLKDRIADSEGYEERLNEASWTHQIGILITRNEANLIVSELEKPTYTAEELEGFARWYHLMICFSKNELDFVGGRPFEKVIAQWKRGRR